MSTPPLNRDLPGLSTRFDNCRNDWPGFRVAAEALCRPPAYDRGGLEHDVSEHPVTFPAGRPALVPSGPTPSRTYAAGSPERATIAAALAGVRGAGYDIGNRVGSD